MLRFLLKLTLLISALFVLAIGVIRAQLYDDGGLRDFLFNSPGCENIPDDQPCFMGIQLGVTTIEEASSLLAIHPWLTEVDIRDYEDGDYYISWLTWSGYQPRIITDASGGHIILSENIVSEIALSPRITFGELWLLLGSPTTGQDYSYADEPNFYFTADFEREGIGVLNRIPCPPQTRQFWLANGTLYFSDSDEPTNDYVLPIHEICLTDRG